MVQQPPRQDIESQFFNPNLCGGGGGICPPGSFLLQLKNG